MIVREFYIIHYMYIGALFENIVQLMKRGIVVGYGDVLSVY